MEDNRHPIVHLGHFYGHAVNATIKSFGGKGIETWGIYKSISPDKAKKGPWSKEEDDKRALYHLEKFGEKMQKFNDRCEWLMDRGLF